MSNPLYTPIDKLHVPLANKLYKDHYPAGKANKADRLWAVKENSTWLGLIKYRDYERFTFMSAMLVVPERRGEGIASELIKASISSCNLDVYCFAYEHLERLYVKNGFKVIDKSLLPNDLATRFVRYTEQGGKKLLPMQYSVAECE
ncbi:GNAT family N-acetyltransferase [Thaumasiovibrio subtropicus]|uniref:GNAT family N-acetyltransferase n=1 Tax=Thaumasiovibrio subtropicus TaxID=1891207 RepID=UPI000B34D8C3|nr:GNAT family N-acetyltransferase [Thaumasiovibrio subtropicus]